MNEDIRITLRQKGYVRQPDGSYSKAAFSAADSVAAGVCATKPKPDLPSSLDQSKGDEDRVLARARVRVVRKSVGSLDRDNLYGSVKSLLDGLQKAGLISSDAEKDIDLEVVQEKVKTRAEQGTKIIIEEI